MDRPEPPRRRHVWVDTGHGDRHPGLVLAWRRAGDGGWEAQVAMVQLDAVLLDWRPAAELRPVADDGWHDPHPHGWR